MGRKIVSGASGKMGRLFIGEAEFCAEDWDIKESGDEQDTTNTCGGGAGEQEIGVTWLEGSINYTWDVADNPYVGPPVLSIGSKHANTKLYMHSSPGVGLQDGRFWAFTLHVVDHSHSVPVKGKVSGTISFKSHGSFTLPTGDDSSGA